jgi:hypothetical protein
MAPRLTALAVLSVLLLGTTTLTYAAQQRITATKPPTATKPAVPPLLVVPNVSGQAYVFAKGTLQDAGFAWRVEGLVRGYAANTVVEQRPAAGRRVVDTGAPLVVLSLRANKRYAQDGEPEDASPYPGTEIRYPNAPAKPKRVVKPKPKPAAPKPKPAARPPAFRVPGARKEPLDEIPLTERADKLAAWIDSHPRRTNPNVQRWLYQHAWIVTGAEFGWWHGDQALVKLIAVDRQVEQIWGIGHRSEKVARAALARVRRQEK